MELRARLVIQIWPVFGRASLRIGQLQPCERGFDCRLEVLGEATGAVDPTERSFNDPTFWQHPTTRPAFPRFLLHSWGRPQMSWIWCGKHLVRKSGSNLDTENNFVELIDETLNLT